MVVKIDAYALALAVANAKEKRFPRKQYEEGRMIKSNWDGVLRKYKNANICMSAPINLGMITSKTNVYKCKYKEKKFFSSKTIHIDMGQINIILKDQPNSLIFFNNSKAVVLFVDNEDISKFDVLQNVSEDGLIDLAKFITDNNIFLDYFELIL